MSVHPVTRRDGSTAHEARWREGKVNRGKRFDRKSDAREWDTEMRRRRQLGPLASARTRGVTLGDWIVKRWAPQHGATLEDGTRELYARLYARHIEPDLGHLLLYEITVDRLRDWQVALLDDGVTVDQVLKARTVLSSVLRHATEAQAINANALKLVRPPAREHRDEVHPYTPTDVERLRRVLGPRDATIVSVLAYAGLRPSELRALRWSDIRQRTILVQRAARPDGTIKSTKTERSRTVKLLAPLAEDLAAWRERSDGKGRGLVFPNDDDGRVWTYSAWAHWRRTRWRPACDAIGLEPIPRPYDLRHSFASLLLAEGKSVHYVAKQLGHAPELTLRVYGHVIDEYADLPPDQRPIAVDEIRRARRN